MAALFIGELDQKIAWIAEVDFTGSSREHMRKGLRAVPYRGRCIYFRSYFDRVVVVRVLHGARDVTQQEFKES